MTGMFHLSKLGVKRNISLSDNDTGNPAEYLRRMDGDHVKFFLREWRKAKGWTQDRLAEETGSNKGQISKLETGAQRMNAEWMSRFSQALGIRPSDLMRHPDKQDAAPLSPIPSAKMIAVPIVGTVQAGIWREVEALWLDAEEQKVILSIEEPPYKPGDLVGYRVAGDSMNLLCQDGGIALCVDFAKSGLALRTGLIVVAEREEHGKVELTLKEVGSNGNGWELIPRSTNKHYKTIILNGDDEGVTVSVKAIVLRFITPRLI
ncbi:helix-turn-helix domain-containing protein [Stappia sp. F7233]|uniref:Helix-turn-helix domain-containing protein n=1 Tax=Stappia albiluteola TaxID=2758565 RepID=A0A839AGS3_9HYPH|nr:XRE family transcriptional regulator [Stappia albiluteola]MBA5778238.1 helix-turn-helix domain-containing protein [Stappia albiluteola]